MKKFLLAGFAALLLLGCSETKETGEGYNPYRPISGLVIPTRAATGEQITLKGRGFAQDCSIVMQLNGQAGKTEEVQVVSVTGDGAEIVVPATLEMGFYAIILNQNAVKATIGGINVVVNEYLDEDFELYVYAGTQMNIFPVSVSKQVKPSEFLPNSSLVGVGYSVFAEAVAKKVYYATMNEENMGGRYRQFYQVGSYDLSDRTAQGAKEVAEFFAMGQIDGKFHLLKVDKGNQIYTLVEVADDGTEKMIQTFDVGASGGSKIYPHDLRFVYHGSSKSVIIYGNMGVGSDMGQATFTLDLASGAVKQNGGDATRKYWFVAVENELYCFAVQFNDDKTSTQVLRITDPRNWNLKGTGAVLVTTFNTGFENPVYSPITKRIYGVDDAETFGSLQSFNVQQGALDARRWVNPGMSGYFYAPWVSTQD